MRLVLVLCALISSSPAIAGARVFQNFTNDAGGWAALDAANYPWSVASGYYQNDIASTNGASSITLYSSTRTWQDNFVYSFDIYSSYTGTGNLLGAVFGYTSAGNYYEVVTNIQGNVTVRRYQGGAEAWVATGTVPAFPADTFVPVQLSLMNGSLSLLINGQPTTFYNGTPNLGVTPVNGRIGLVTRSDLGRFDNVNVIERIFRGNFTDQGTGLGVAISDPNSHCTPDNPPNEKTCYANITGNDTSGYSWPIRMWDNDVDPSDPNALGALLQYIPHITSGTATDYLGAAIEMQTGHGGTPTHVLHQQIKQAGTAGNMTPQIPYAIRPLNAFNQQHDLYARFWLKYPNGLDGPSGTNSWWQMPFQFTTSNDTTADATDSLRMSLFATNTPTHNGVNCDQAHPENNPPAGRWHWLVQADPGEAFSKDDVYWQKCNPTAAVPFAQWFKVEIFFHRAPTSGSTGRIWVAIAGQEVLDYTVPATTFDKGMYSAASPIQRINPHRSSDSRTRGNSRAR